MIIGGGLRNVCPNCASGDSPDMRLRNAIPISQDDRRDSISRLLANFAYLRLGQFCHSVLLASRHSISVVTRTRTPFMGHVSHVIGSRPKPEVSRVAANRLVARVTAKEAIWDWANRQRIRESGRDRRLPWAQIDCAISVPVQAACPRPALVRAATVHLGPEADGHWYSGVGKPTGAGAEPLTIRGMWAKDCPAVFAGPLGYLRPTGVLAFWRTEPLPTLASFRTRLLVWGDARLERLAAVLAGTRGKINLHVEPPIRCAAPEAVSAVLGHFCA